MLSAEANAYLCDVEPGTPMHELLRRYWIPAGLSQDLPGPESEPVRTQLLGRNYVMFRDSGGALGLLDDQCCHRGASLALGRVEPGGLRCIYHGWKFAVDGRVLEMPNVGDAKLGKTFRQPSYPVREAGGLIWVYLGPAEKEPPFRHYPFFDVPEERRYIGAPLINANFMQILEGSIDSAHLGVLHYDAHVKGAVSVAGDKPVVGQIRDQFVGAAVKPPRIEVADTPWGLRYAALRDLVREDGTPCVQARVTSFFFPFCSNVTDEGTILFAVPANSEWTVHYQVFWCEDPVHGAAKLDQLVGFLGWKDEPLKARERARLTQDIGPTPNRSNHFNQRRAAMRRNETFSGFDNVIIEDIAVTETMGAIMDRTREHLVPSDAAIVRARRAMTRNARRVEAGEEPQGVALETAPAAGQGFVTPERPWQAWFEEAAPNPRAAE